RLERHARLGDGTRRTRRGRTAGAAGARPRGADRGPDRQPARAAGRLASGDPQPVNLADDGAARHAAELARHLTGRQPLAPKLGERLDALLAPFHGTTPGLKIPALTPYLGDSS